MKRIRHHYEPRYDRHDAENDDPFPADGFAAVFVNENKHDDGQKTDADKTYSLSRPFSRKASGEPFDDFARHPQNRRQTSNNK